MSSGHNVVVWEYQSEGEWLPHTPGVTRTLERAHTKKLTRVVLADADPALKGHYVNLRTLTQCQDTPDGGTIECLVRRACYSSSAGRGACWEWALVSRANELHYEPMPMELQCSVENAWCSGTDVVQWRGWCLNTARGTARRGGALRLVRRVPRAPYPRDPPAPSPGTLPARQTRIPQQHTGSSVHSVQSTISTHSNHSVQSVQSNHSVQSIQSNHSVQSVQSNHSVQSSQSAGGRDQSACRGGARSASPRDRKPGLARQILHNLNIFSNNNKQLSPSHGDGSLSRESETEEQRTTDTECGSTRSARRHSVDTVSTYLSHESKDSMQRGSVNSVLNCSGGSDDVFDAPIEEPALLPDQPNRGIEGLSPRLVRFVRAVQCPQWGALCAACLQPLGGGALALPCHHMEHLHCLQRRTDHTQEPLYIECLVCGRGYGGARTEPPPVPAPAPAPAQPPGSMAWRLQHAALPQDDSHASILVTYNFQSGRQGPEQPRPGAPYYAVGFPRHSLLPDSPLGRQVLSALRVAWERRLLFTVWASQTTGREYVVAWRVSPPPSCRSQYAPPANPTRLLLCALSRLQAIINPQDSAPWQ